MSEVNINNHFLIPTLIVLCLAGCTWAPYEAPDFVSSDFKADKIDYLFVMPILDFRIDKEEQLPPDEWFHEIIQTPLERKNYRYHMIKDRSWIAGIREEKFKKPNPVWLADMGPSEAKWLFFIVIHDVTSKLTLGSTGNAEMSGFIFDKIAGKLVWQNRVAAQTGRGGLLGLALKGTMAETAISIGIHEIIEGLPVKDKETSLRLKEGAVMFLCLL